MKSILLIHALIQQEKKMAACFKKGMSKYTSNTVILWHGGSQSFYLVKGVDAETKKTKYIYLSKENKETISILANGLYYRRQYDAAIYNIKLLQSTEKRMKNHEKYFNDCDTRFGEYVDDDLLSDKERAKRWATSEYMRNNYPLSPSSMFETKKGDIVRSKAELVIADWLWDNNVPYRYEASLIIPGEQYPIFPDFTILSLKTNEPIYLEYFGKMTEQGYCVDMLNRVNRYAKAGIVFGKNLIALFEGDGVPMNTVTLTRTLQQFL